MTARILIFGKNNSLPADAAQSCAAGLHATPGIHSLKPAATRQIGDVTTVPCYGVPAWSHISSPPRASSFARGNSAPSPVGKVAFLFDATAGRWIVTPSGMMPDAGAAADLRHTDETCFPPLPSPAVGPTAVGRFLRDAAEAVVFAAGLTVFGLIAAFFLVLA